MGRELSFHDVESLTEQARDTRRSLGWFLICVEIMVIICCFEISFGEYRDRYKEDSYNEAVQVFNDLSFEQRQMFCENLLDADNLVYLNEEKYIIAGKSKAPRMTSEAIVFAFECLFCASVVFFLIYLLFCLLYGFYLADFPFKGTQEKLLLPIFLLAGWPFFLMSYLRIRNAKKKAYAHLSKN